MTPLKSNPSVRRASADAVSLEELKAQRRERLAVNKRVEELKLGLLRIADHHMDHVVRLIRRWLRSE